MNIVESNGDLDYDKSIDNDVDVIKLEDVLKLDGVDSYEWVDFKLDNKSIILIPLVYDGCI